MYCTVSNVASQERQKYGNLRVNILQLITLITCNLISSGGSILSNIDRRRNEIPKFALKTAKEPKFRRHRHHNVEEPVRCAPAMDSTGCTAQLGSARQEREPGRRIVLSARLSFTTRSLTTLIHSDVVVKSTFKTIEIWSL